jgi:hypothetical protein
VYQDEQYFGANGSENSGENSKPNEVKLVRAVVAAKAAADKEAKEVGSANGGTSNSRLLQ